MGKKHNKLKNTGILFEVLINMLTKSIMSHDIKIESRIKGIMKTNFNDSEIYKEYNLYKRISEATIPKNDFNNFISQIIKSRKLLDEHKLNSEKYNLIKELKNYYDLGDILKKRISNYKLYASVYNLFEYVVNNNVNKKILMNSTNTIKEHVTGHKTDKNKLLSEFKELDSNTRIISYGLLLKKFNTKYSNINENQKKLLSSYINSISNDTSLKEYIDTEIAKFKRIVEKQLKLNNIDNRLKIKITELYKRLNDMFIGDIATDNHVLNLLRIYEIQNDFDTIK